MDCWTASPMSPNIWHSRCSRSGSRVRSAATTSSLHSLQVRSRMSATMCIHLTCFCAGSAINWDGHFRTETQDQIFFTVIDLLLNCGCFVYIGAWMPFHMFNAPELGITPWRLVVLFVCVLLLRRIPPLFLLYKWVPEIGSWREALFTGHFGS